MIIVCTLSWSNTIHIFSLSFVLFFLILILYMSKNKRRKHFVRSLCCIFGTLLVVSIVSTICLILWVSNGLHPFSFLPVGVTNVGYFPDKRTLTIFTTVLKADVLVFIHFQVGWPSAPFSTRKLYTAPLGPGFVLCCDFYRWYGVDPVFQR